MYFFNFYTSNLLKTYPVLLPDVLVDDPDVVELFFFVVLVVFVEDVLLVLIVVLVVVLVVLFKIGNALSLTVMDMLDELFEGMLMT